MESIEMNDQMSNQTIAPRAVNKSSVALVFGILSIVSCCCIGLFIVSLVLAILAVVWGNEGVKEYQATPDLYTLVSFKNAKAAKVCGIIGLCLSGTVLFFVIAIVVFALSVASIALTSMSAIFPEIISEIINEITSAL
ncbi:MAG: hypothetical protein MJ069_00225 [Salinivirgaceae bacterium]|nr:hypothetical protein [Salinivirgaceae bacterium]